ncbi:MAG TPA: TetR/AcrR family transcriptional regulator [Pseudonocardiaceae bacterium]|jgi:AcrR family transcriptional regulator|nr:TetR/AcrR family transcriptional regulator [Pseudonocardiaceae bacterium]
MAGAPANPRERYRQQVRDEIKGHAWTQIADTGASALSLNAIAKLMGMSGPALYRYFANRDELITELVLDAYRDLAEVTRAAAAAAAPDDRLGELATAIRRWALANPHRYLLIYGTPVPGYAAPPEATTIAGSVMALLVTAYTRLTTHPTRSPAQRVLEDHLAGHQGWAGDAAPAVAHAALTFWTRVHGVLSLELAGHFTGMGFDPALLYAAEVESVTSNRRRP